MKQSSGLFELVATDLSNHLSCEHLTQLERKAALGEIRKPQYRDPSLDILIQRGRDHEAAYVKYLSESGKRVIDLRGQSHAATLEAMKQGVDVIVQAQLKSSPWGGFAEFLKMNAIEATQEFFEPSVWLKKGLRYLFKIIRNRLAKRF